ncbi:MAG: Ig-like domain-containing protein, partial [Planctomycetota bacterium]
MREKMILGSVALACVLMLFGTGCYESGDYPTDFIVLSCFPANGQTNVPQSSQISIRFSNPPNHQTIQGTEQIILVDSANSPMPVTFTFQGEVLNITPLSPLASASTYGIAVRPGVRDVFGSNISVPYSTTFSTGQTVSTIANFPPFVIGGGTGPAPGGTPGTFTRTGPMVFARARHRMTRLIDGRVLATGGENDSPLGRVLRSAELFDPATYQWTLSNSLGTGINGMNFERYGHTSTLLKDGRVLIAGGTDNHKVLNLAEIYNPKHDVFAAVPSRMVLTRCFHTAELLENGNVLLMCGWCNNMVANAASQSGWGTVSYLLDSMEVFDVYAGTFSMVGNRLL